MKKIRYARIVKAVKGLYEMSLVGEERDLITKMVNMGIDSHLEACFVPDRGDSYEVRTHLDIAPCERFPNGASVAGPRLECKVSGESLAVLLRRLCEDTDSDESRENDDCCVGNCLATDILNGLGINCDMMDYEIVK